MRASGVAVGEGFNGRLQRVAVYDTPLSPARIQGMHDIYDEYEYIVDLVTYVI